MKARIRNDFTRDEMICHAIPRKAGMVWIAPDGAVLGKVGDPLFGHTVVRVIEEKRKE